MSKQEYSKSLTEFLAIVSALTRTFEIQTGKCLSINMAIHNDDDTYLPVCYVRNLSEEITNDQLDRELTEEDLTMGFAIGLDIDRAINANEKSICKMPDESGEEFRTLFGNKLGLQYEVRFAKDENSEFKKI